MSLMHRSEDDADQIDLAYYAAVIGRRWKLVLGCTVLTVLVAIVASMVLARVAPRYQSTVTIVLTGPRYKITFDPRFTNVDSVTAPVAARADEYRAVAMSPEVHLATIQALSGQLAPVDVEEVAVN